MRAFIASQPDLVFIEDLYQISLAGLTQIAAREWAREIEQMAVISRAA